MIRKTAMFSKADGIKDVLDDVPGRLARKIQSFGRWNSETLKLREELIKTLSSRGYIEFDANVTNYGTWQVGESTLMYVPPSRRGALSVFTGKTIRLVCTISGRYTRGLMAGVVRLPKELRTQVRNQFNKNQLELAKQRAAAEPYLKQYLRRLGIRGKGRADGLVFLAAKEMSSMVSTWTDILALERIEPGQCRLHHGGLEIMGSVNEIESGRTNIDVNGHRVAPKQYKGQRVVGLADGEFMLSNKFYAEESSEPFGWDNVSTCASFLKEQGWADPRDVDIITGEVLKQLRT
jgi:hypothetical protein